MLQTLARGAENFNTGLSFVELSIWEIHGYYGHINKVGCLAVHSISFSFSITEDPPPRSGEGRIRWQKRILFFSISILARGIAKKWICLILYKNCLVDFHLAHLISWSETDRASQNSKHLLP